MSERFHLADFEFVSRDTRTRFPFRYGIASMTEVPHQFLRVRVERPGGACLGIASEGLPPKWFTKNPETPFEADLADMRRVIAHAAVLSAEIGRRPVSFFEFWQALSRQQAAWARTEGVPPLLASLGVSLCERAVLDGLCRSLGQPLNAVIHANLLGLRLGDIYPELTGVEPASLLPPAPSRRAYVRHTVGLTDPLRPSDITAEERVDDGLPHDLQSCVRAYGLRYFKIKLSGQAERDTERLRGLVDLLTAEAGAEWFATVDANEFFTDFGAFRSSGRSCCAARACRVSPATCWPSSSRCTAIMR